MAGAVKPKKVRKKTKAEVYVEEIQKLGWEELWTMWEHIAARKKIPNWPEGKAFEHLALRAFELDGASVTWPYSVTLEQHVVEQIDGMVSCDGLTFLAEAKDYDSDLNVEPLAKLRNQLLRRPGGVIGCVFSSSGFTAPARTLAQYMSPQAILLWNGPEIATLLENKQGFRHALQRKFYWLQRQGMPDYDTRTDGI